MPLTEAQIERYSRQIILPEVGGMGQEKLLRGRVRLRGPGAFARWAALYLGAAGVGEIVLDGPWEETIRGMNPDCRVSPAPETAPGPPAAVVIAAADDADRAALVADWTAGSAVVLARTGTAGGTLEVLRADRAESSCPVCALSWHARPDPGGAETPPIGGDLVVAPVLATLAATEALKLLLGVGEGLVGRHLLYDAAAQAFTEEPGRCDPGCTTRSRAGVVAGNA
jgi:adenylyltransferase/sulfurtransferase